MEVNKLLLPLVISYGGGYHADHRICDLLLLTEGQDATEVAAEFEWKFILSTWSMNLDSICAGIETTQNLASMLKMGVNKVSIDQVALQKLLYDTLKGIRIYDYPDHLAVVYRSQDATISFNVIQGQIDLLKFWNQIIKYEENLADFEQKLKSNYKFQIGQKNCHIGNMYIIAKTK